jgi:hypothetical protein
VLHCAISIDFTPGIPRALSRVVAHRGLAVAGFDIEVELDTINFQAWTTAEEFHPKDLLLDFSVEKLSDQPDQSLASVICAVCQGLSFAQLVRLFVHDPPAACSKQSAWGTVFGIFSNLQILSVTSPSIEELVLALRPMHRTGTRKSEPWQIPLPKLRALSLFEVHFDHGVADFLDCLRARLEHNTKLQALQLWCCKRLSRLDVHLLEDMADVVDWDEDESFSSSCVGSDEDF